MISESASRRFNRCLADACMQVLLIVFSILTPLTYASDATDLRDPNHWLPKFTLTLGLAGLKPPIQEAIVYMGDMQFSRVSALHAILFGPETSGLGYLRYLDNAKSIIYLPNPNPSLMAYADINTSSMVLTDQFRTRRTSRIDTISTLVHESHHLDPKFAKHHIPCPSKDLNGEPIIGHATGNNLVGQKGCDIAWHSSYGVEAVMLDNIARFCLTCTEEEKQEARFLADQYLKRIVNPNAYKILTDDRI